MSQTKFHQTLNAPALESLGPVTAEEACLLEKLDLTRLPRHVAVIMDGNGRWAQKRHLPRIAGHRQGTQSARTTIETCVRLKIEADRLRLEVEDRGVGMMNKTGGGLGLIAMRERAEILRGKLELVRPPALRF